MNNFKFRFTTLMMTMSLFALPSYAGLMGMDLVEEESANQSSSSDNQDIYALMTSDTNVKIPSEKFPEIYANFCKENPEVQSIIDYLMIKNNKDKIYIQDIPKHINFNSESYVSYDYGIHYLSFPLDGTYNSITWTDEPMKFHYLVSNSWAVAPIYNITNKRGEKPTGRLTMPIAIGHLDHFLGADTPRYQNDCKTDNTCNEKLDGFNPFRSIMLVTREADNGGCSVNYFRSEIVDIENHLNSNYAINEVKLYMPHGNPRFEIMQKDWVSKDGKTTGFFTYDLNKLNIDGVSYKMIPGGKVFGNASWYLKGQGPLHEKWIFVYAVGDNDNVYCKSDNPKCHTATKVIVQIFDKSDFGRDNPAAPELIARRIALYPKK